MPVKDIMNDHTKVMEKSIAYLQNEFRGIRTGRASTGLVENIRVDYYGSPTPLNQMATLTAPDATSIVIKPFDATAQSDIIKGIKASDLGLQPVAEGRIIRLNIPPLSEERRKQIVQQIKQMGEHARVSVRNVRRDANKMLDDEQKAKLISEDERDKGKKDADSMTKKYISKVDEMVKSKCDEIMTD